MAPVTDIQRNFIAPEIRDISGRELESALKEYPFACDLYSVAAIAKLLLTGQTQDTADELEGTVSAEMQEFLRRTENEDPVKRLGAKQVINLELFDQARLTRQAKDAELHDQFEARKSIVAQRMKALGSASIFEQIIVRFVASNQQS